MALAATIAPQAIPWRANNIEVECTTKSNFRKARTWTTFPIEIFGELFGGGMVDNPSWSGG